MKCLLLLLPLPLPMAKVVMKSISLPPNLKELKNSKMRSAKKPDEMLFQIEALKMDRSYQLSGYHFYLNESNGDITASLDFTKAVAGSDRLFTRKYATMNAKTGELISFSSNTPI